MASFIRIVGMLCALGLAAATSVKAQSDVLQAHIGFDFTAGQTVLPAGTYSVSRLEGSQNVLLIRGSRTGVMLMGRGAGTPSADDGTRLVFHRYGSRYFLRQVWFLGSGGYTLPETREERTWAERVDRTASQPVSVTVAPIQ